MAAVFNELPFEILEKIISHHTLNAKDLAHLLQSSFRIKWAAEEFVWRRVQIVCIESGVISVSTADRTLLLPENLCAIRFILSKKPLINSLIIRNIITLNDDEKYDAFKLFNAYENMTLTSLRLINSNVFADEADISAWFREQLELVPKNKTSLSSIELCPGEATDCAYSLTESNVSSDSEQITAHLSIFFEDAPLSQPLCTDLDEEMIVRANLLSTAVPTAMEIYYRKTDNTAVVDQAVDTDDADKDATTCYLAFLTIISDYNLRRKTIHTLQRILSGVRLLENDVTAVKIGKFIRLGIEDAETIGKAILHECSLLTVLTVSDFPFNLDMFWAVDDVNFFEILKRKSAERSQMWEVTFKEISPSCFRIREGRGTAWFDLITADGNITVDRLRSIVTSDRIP